MPRAKGLPRSLPTSGHPRFCGLSWCAAARLVEAAAQLSSYAGLRLGMRIAHVEEQFRRFADEPA
jgi:hypothetical protein